MLVIEKRNGTSLVLSGAMVLSHQLLTPTCDDLASEKSIEVYGTDLGGRYVSILSLPLTTLGGMVDEYAPEELGKLCRRGVAQLLAYRDGVLEEDEFERDVLFWVKAWIKLRSA